jgi:branched-chain amino acid transport system permease protein
MATLGFGIIISLVVANEDRLTGGPDGLTVVPLTVFGLALQGERVWYWVVGLALLVAVWLALNLIDSPTGRALRALHGSEVGASVAGIDAARHKVLVFVVSAVFAAAAGGLNAHYAGFITPSKVSFLHSIELVTMVVFGGMASTFGAVVGAAVLTALPQLLTVFKDYEMVVLGAVMMGTMIFMPKGLVPTLAAALGGRRGMKAEKPAGTPGAAAEPRP